MTNHDSQYDGNQWHEKERDETTSRRMPEKIFDGIKVSNPGFGLNLYQNAFSKEEIDKVIQLLESSLNGTGPYKWNEAQVTNSATPIKKARDCVDFKMNSKSLGPVNDLNKDLHSVYSDVFNRLRKCVDDYCRYWGINVNFYEVFNFVKYEGEGKHFRIHADDGPSYKCTVSAVIYLNDDYEGGEIHFPRLENLTIKPSFGDIAIFPSNYMYEHASLPMKSGTKYCVVVMMDINNLAHKDNPYGILISNDGTIS
jgi:hypothetical protein